MRLAPVLFASTAALSLATSAQADITVGAPDLTGSAFYYTPLSSGNFNPLAANNFGGSNLADIDEFIVLAYFDISDDVLALAPGESFTGGGTLDFGVIASTSGSNEGPYSGTLQVEYVTSMASIPADGAGYTPDDEVHVDFATQLSATEIYNDAIAEGETDSASISDGVLDTSNNVLLFRFSDANPAALANNYSVLSGISLELTTVPEPGSFACLSILGLAALKRRRR